MRLPALRLLPLLALAALGGACGNNGDGAAEGARVRILTSAADGTGYGTILLEGTADGQTRVFEAQPLADDPAVHVAAGAPPGQYYVASSEGWGMLWGAAGNAGAPTLRGSGHPATTVRIGKPHSLYVAASDPRTINGHVGTDWGVEWKVMAEGQLMPFRPADVQVEAQDAGLVAIRVPKAVWMAGHVLRCCGLFQSGAVSQLISFQIRDPARDFRPRIAFAVAAPQAPLAVHMVPPPGARVVEGTVIEARLQDVPLLARYEAKTHKGVARFEELGSLGHGLLVTVPDVGAFFLDQETWRTRGALHVAAISPEDAIDLALDVPGETIVEARALWMETPIQYARLPLRREGDSVHMRTAAGTQQWLLRTERGTWIEHEIRVDPAKDDAPPVAVRVEGPGRKPVRVRGSVDGGGRGFRVRFTRLLESGAQASGAGLSAAVDPYGQYDARVPGGRYQIQVVRPGGAPARPKTMPLPAGSEVRLDLQAR